MCAPMPPSIEVDRHRQPGFACANAMGLHRFLNTLDLYGTEPPVIAFDPSEVDSRKPGFDPATADA